MLGGVCPSERWFRLKSPIHWLAVWLWVFSAIIKDKSVKVLCKWLGITVQAC